MAAEFRSIGTRQQIFTLWTVFFKNEQRLLQGPRSDLAKTAVFEGVVNMSMHIKSYLVD